MAAQRSPKLLVTKSFSEFMDDNVMRLGAALSFYTVWSIGPLFLVIVSVAGLVFGRDAAQGKVVDAMSGLMGPAGAKSIQDAIVAANDTGHSVMANIVGVVLLLVSASGVFGELKSSLNTVWNVTPKPGSFLVTLKERFFSLTFVMGTGFLLLVSLLLNAAIAALGDQIQDAVPAGEVLGHVIHFVVSLGITTSLFSLMFRFIPDAHVAWKDVWLGGFVTAVLFTIGQVGIGLYLGKTSIGSAYGAASSLMIVLVWIFFSSCILFLGAEFTQVYAEMYGSRIRPTDNAVRIPDGQTATKATEDAKAQGVVAHGT
jgi:membrane protein